MHPNMYQLPQYCSADRQRGRVATLAMMQTRYGLTPDNLVGHPAPGFRLPPYLSSLPKSEKFTGPKFARFAAHELRFDINIKAAKLIMGKSAELDHLGDYTRLYPLVEKPPNLSYAWPDDASFARERLIGVNPMSIREFRDDYMVRADDPQEDVRVPASALGDLLAAAEEHLRAQGTTLEAVRNAGRLFMTDYTDQCDWRVQQYVHLKGRVLACGVSLYWVDGGGRLMPLAIQLRPPGSGTPVYTPDSPRAAWLMARCHAQSSDANVHEIVYHLLETHLVSEVFGVCTARYLHPAHPLNQLFKPHFEFNLAIDTLARGDLLSVGGPIDSAITAGVPGLLDLARIHWQRWSFSSDYFTEDLRARGVHNRATLPGYYLREDGGRIWKILRHYAEDVLGLWYRSDEDVKRDVELQAWAKGLADPLEGAIPGFPERITTRDDLFEIARAVIYRCSAHHASVNNGQFNTYGWIPNCPGMFSYPIPTDRRQEHAINEAELVRSLARMDVAAKQIGMTWTLSEPTHRSLLALGDSDAFLPQNNFDASQAVETTRLRLGELSMKIQQRNAGLEHPYTYLDPRSIARSTGT